MNLYIAILVLAALIIAVVTDLKDQRIPNWLTFTLALAGLAFHGVTGGLDGLGFSLIGLAIGLGVMLPPYLIGVMGGGDVKLMAAVGACLGAGDTDWVERVRDLERYARSEKLDFNLIINCQIGGGTSDALFSENTLKYLDLYHGAGGRPDRYIVQSWYDYPKTIVPETRAGSMTHLVAEVIRRTKGIE